MWFCWRWVLFGFVKREYVQRGVYEKAIKEVGTFPPKTVPLAIRVG